MFHKILPNILNDHHEMGTNSTYFFQPGVKTRSNPLTPKKNFELTQKITDFHSKAFDKNAMLYFTQENFDDFYYGKGSTYPDALGSIGLLFEQSRVRGKSVNTANGKVTFQMAVRNQFTASLASIEAGGKMRTELLEYQRNFYTENAEKARNYSTKAWVFGVENDKIRLITILSKVTCF